MSFALQIAKLWLVVAETIRPPKAMTVTEWAETYRWISSERSAKRGKFVAWPFQREPMDVLSVSDPTEFIVFMCAIQVLKTTAMENAIGAYIHHDPGPILVIQPRDPDAETFSKESIDPMVRDTPELAERVVRKKSREAGNTTLYKRFRGGILTMLGSQEAANFQMRSIRFAFGDEVDRWKQYFKREGSAIRLFINRTENFRGQRKVLLASSPTVKGSSPIYEWWLKSDQRKFFVPCPRCGYEQVLVWDQVRYSEEFVSKPSEAKYQCANEECGYLIEHWRKRAMLERGRWIKGNPESKIAGFQLSRLYSPITPWGAMAEEFVQIKHIPGELQGWINTQLGEPWEERGEAPDWEIIRSRHEEYRKGTVPEGVLFLTAGIDLQADRLEVSVYGWGADGQRWLIDHRVLWGDTHNQLSTPWLQLESMWDEIFLHECGARMTIRRFAIDSGHDSEAVYAFARRMGSDRLLVVKGADRMPSILGAPSTTEALARRKKRGVMLWRVDVGRCKWELFRQLKMPLPDFSKGEKYPAGWFHHYEETIEFYQQLVAEEWVATVDKRGYSSGQWRKIGRNEVLDCANYARAAAQHVGLMSMREDKWEQLRLELADDAAAARREEAALVQPKSTSPPPVQRAGWRHSRPGGWFSR